MKRFTVLFVILLNLVLCAINFAQEAEVLFYYSPNEDNTNPPLGCPCVDSTPFPDGVMCCVFWDNNYNGWDGEDEPISANFSCFPMNGDETSSTPGYFVGPMLVILQLPTSPDTALYGIVINYVNGADTCCWVTRSYLVQPGIQEISIPFSDWICSSHACISNVLPPDHLVSDVSTIPNRYTLTQNYPNPFNSKTEIRFDLIETAPVELTIYNTQGQKVATLVNEIRNPGTYRQTWNGKNANGLAVASGMYLYQIKAGSFVQTKKMVLLR